MISRELANLWLHWRNGNQRIQHAPSGDVSSTNDRKIKLVHYRGHVWMMGARCKAAQWATNKGSLHSEAPLEKWQI